MKSCSYYEPMNTAEAMKIAHDFCFETVFMRLKSFRRVKLEKIEK